jgi:hypothetical protein
LPGIAAGKQPTPASRIRPSWWQPATTSRNRVEVAGDQATTILYDQLSSRVGRAQRVDGRVSRGPVAVAGHGEQRGRER